MILIREFHYPDDYAAVKKLWEGMEKGVQMGRSDAAEEIEKKTSRDPDLFLIAEEEGNIVGSVIGGYDGRRGLLYHLAVAKELVTLDNPEVEHFYQKRGWHFMDYVRPFGKELL